MQSEKKMDANKKEPKRSVFQIIFGNEMGDMVQFIFGLVAFIVGIYLFTLIPSFLIDTFSSSKKAENKVNELNKLPPDMQSVIAEIGKAGIKTQELLKKLEEDINDSEKILETKKTALKDLQQKIDFLKLTPEQIKIVSEYEKSFQKRMTIKEWIIQSTNLYNTIITIIISAFFYLLGKRKGKRIKNIQNSQT